MPRLMIPTPQVMSQFNLSGKIYELPIFAACHTIDGRKATPADINEIVRNTKIIMADGHVPPVKIGHDKRPLEGYSSEYQEPPALPPQAKPPPQALKNLPGFLTGLYPGEDLPLRGFVKDVRKKKVRLHGGDQVIAIVAVIFMEHSLAEWYEAGLYPGPSVEIAREVTRHNGQKLGKTIMAVAMLGRTIPAYPQLFSMNFDEMGQMEISNHYYCSHVDHPKDMPLFEAEPQEIENKQKEKNIMPKKQAQEFAKRTICDVLAKNYAGTDKYDAAEDLTAIAEGLRSTADVLDEIISQLGAEETPAGEQQDVPAEQQPPETQPMQSEKNSAEFATLKKLGMVSESDRGMFAVMAAYNLDDAINHFKSLKATTQAQPPKELKAKSDDKGAEKEAWVTNAMQEYMTIGHYPEKQARYIAEYQWNQDHKEIN